MSSSKVSFDETLLEKVVMKETCMGCGACVIVCPFGCLEYSEGKPKLVKKCEVCGICPRVCPQYSRSWPELEKMIFGRERRPDEEFGIHRRAVVAQTTDEAIMQNCQDGGVVTALLTFALKSGIIDGAILSGVSAERAFCPVPKLVTTPEDILKCAGTRYTYSPNLLVLPEAVKERKSLAVVGTPCQIHSLRKMEAAKMKKYVDKIKFKIGLMCTEVFTYEGLMEDHLQRKLGTDLRDIRKINIKGKVIITTKSGETRAIPLSEAKQFTRKGCLPCPDFSAELSDISVGGLGLSGWSFTIIRTEDGDGLFGEAEKSGVIKTRPVEEEKNAFDLLIKLSKKKRKLT